MVYLKSVENVITLGKLIGLLFLFCLPLLSILFLKTKRNDLALPVLGTIFLVQIFFTAVWLVAKPIDYYRNIIKDPNPLFQETNVMKKEGDALELIKTEMPPR